MGQATPLAPSDEEIKTAPEGGYASGEIVQAPSGKAGYVDGLKNVEAGLPATIRTSGRIQVAALSTLVGSPSDGVPVQVDWDDTNNRIVAEGAGDFPLGTLAKDKENGETTAEVNLNDPGNTFPVWMPTGAPQALSDAGAVNVTSFRTNWTTTGAAAGTLADGVKPGQLKKVQLIVDGGDGTLTPANFSDGTTITFADAGDFAVLRWDGSNWKVLELGNDADGATAPVVA